VQIDPGYIPAWHNWPYPVHLKGAAGVTQALQKLSASDPTWPSLAPLIIEYSCRAIRAWRRRPSTCCAAGR